MIIRFGAALFLFATTLASASSVPNVRTSNLSQDIVISHTLFHALSASAGKVPLIQSQGASVSLISNNDQITCSASGCTLRWDADSPNSAQDAASFHVALYNALSNWALGDGANDPAVHRVVYAQTGSLKITVSDDIFPTDRIECTLLNSAGARGFTQCSLVVSDYLSGVGQELESLYSNLLAAHTLISAQAQALLGTVSTSQFVTPGKPTLIEAVHTLYTDLLVDGYSVSAYFDYVTPITNAAGQIISDGIEITLGGSLSSLSGAYDLQQVQAQSYVKPRHSP